jgi:hypothetical protein
MEVWLHKELEARVVHVRTLCERYWYGRCELSLPLLVCMHLQHIQ